jgi:integrase
LKNTASKRRVPLHPHVRELGFAGFVHSEWKRGKLSLFPEAIPAHLRRLANLADGSEAACDKKFADVLDHMVRICLERSLNGNRPGPSCHGMRHSVNDHLSNLRQEDGISHVLSELDRMGIMGRPPNCVNAATYRRAEKPLGPSAPCNQNAAALF